MEEASSWKTFCSFLTRLGKDSSSPEWVIYKPYFNEVEDTQDPQELWQRLEAVMLKTSIPDPHWEEVKKVITTPMDGKHVSIRLIRLPDKSPISWGEILPPGIEVAIAARNPTDPRIRVTCSVVDANERSLATQGKNTIDLSAREANTMVSFTTQVGVTYLHFLVAELPLREGSPLYHSRLIVNVQ